MTEVVSDENEWNPDADENARNINKKFGKRTNKAEFNKQRDLLRKAHNPRLYKELVNQSGDYRADQRSDNEYIKLS